MTYSEKLKEAFTLLKSNLNLFIPDIVFFIYIILFSLLILKINEIPILSLLSKETETLKQILGQIISEAPRLIKVCVSVFIFLLISVAFGISLSATKYLMIKKAVTKQKPRFKESFKESARYIFSLFLLKFIVILIFLLSAVIPIAVILLIKSSQPFWSLIILPFIIIWIFIGLAFYFRIPILFMKTKNVLECLKQSYRFFINNKEHTIFVALILIGISIAFAILSAPIYKILTLNTATSKISFLLQFFVNTAVSLYKIIFLFLNYKN